MFISVEQDRARLPVLLLSGFLGSGKTTLINALLQRPALSQTAVAINEFGEVPIDQHLIDHGADRTIVMANGCLCCNLAGDLEDSVMRIFSRRDDGAIPDFKRLIIEPSGLADPAPIAFALLRNPIMARVMRLQAIMATVDAVFGAQHMARHAETRQQIGLADTIIITKADMVDGAALAAVTAQVRQLNPVARILNAVNGDIDPGLLLPEGFLKPEAGSSAADYVLPAHAGAVGHGHVHDTVSISLVAEQPLRWRAVEAWLRDIRLRYAESLLRVKGILNVAGSGAPLVIQGVHHVLHAPVALPAWPSEDRRSRLVLIIRGADSREIVPSWQAALPGFYEQAA